MIGVQQVKAYTVSDLTSAGWTKVTSITDVDNYYYVFVDAGSSNYSVGRLEYNSARPVYMPLADPMGFAGEVWYLGADGDNYTIKNLGDNKFFISGTEGWNDSMADNQWGNEGLFTFTADLPSGKFSIQSVKTSVYVGPWNNDNAVKLTDGYENIAANKADYDAPGFYVYSMPRETYEANRITASWLTSHGWSQVTDNSALGNVDNYYLIIEKVSFGYAMARTSNGRPASKSLSNPFATKNELWLIAAKGSGYSLQNVVDGTYFTSAAGDWNTSMSNSPNADIIATVSDGVYTLSAGGTSNIGHWRNGTTFPYENESVAANKTDGDRNSYYIYTISKTDYATQRASYIASLAASATKAAPVDLTSYVFNNSDFATLAKLGWTVSGSWGNQQTSNGAYETWNSNNVSVTQELSNMPGGKYQLSVQMVSGNAGRVPYVYASADEEYTANVTQQATDASYDGMRNEIAADPDYGKISVTPFLSNGTLTVGMKAPSGWVVFDNYKLYYQGPTLASKAVALPDGGAMTAGTWYYFDITVAGDNYNATATALDKIICISDGKTLLEDATSGDVILTETGNSLEVKRYYVKSSSDNSLVVAPASYSYEVSEATADKAYIQPSQTINVSFVVNTNDPSAVLSQDYSGVTFDGIAINVTPGDNGFSFTAPADLEAGVEHTLYIPAGVIGYAAGDTYNAEQNISLTAVAIYDGVYYMYNTDTKTYISRAGNYNTQAIQDNWGLAFNVSTDANNNTKLQYFDSKLWLGDDGFCYGDVSGDRVRSFNVAKVTGGYKFLNTNNNKYLAVYHNQTVADAVEGGNLQGTSNIWYLESTTEHKDNYTKNENVQAASVASAAGLTGVTTKAGLAEVLANNYGESDVNITGSKAEKFQVYPGSGKEDGPVTYYSETVENLKPGIYKLSVGAFQRAAGNGRVAAADGARSLIYLYAGANKTQIMSVMEYGAPSAYAGDFEYEGKHYPNDEASAYVAIGTGNYQNDVYVYLAEAGSLEIGIKNPTRLGGDFSTWAVYDNWTLTYYEAKATPAEKEALADAIEAVEDNVAGFETGEYAPYNNIEAFAALAAAQAIDPDNASGAAVVAATTALTGATWTANVSEVNAVYNGTFALSENNGAPAGWTMSNNTLGGALHSRAFVGDSRLSEFNGTNSGFFQRYDGTNSSRGSQYYYGNTTGYTMPLKANTIYHVTADFTNWGTTDEKPLTLNVDGPNSTTVAYEDKTSTKNADSGSDTPDKFDIIFTTGDAGNYTIRFQVKGSDSNAHNVLVSNVELKKAVATAKMQISGQAKMGTFCAPFDVTIPDGVKAYTLSESETSKETMVHMDEITDVIPAGTPVLVASDTKYENDFEDYMTVLNPINDDEDNLLKGTFVKAHVAMADGNYILQYQGGKCAFYLVDDDDIYIGKNRCYLHIDGATEARITIGEEDPTAINSIEAGEEAEGLKDGKYLIDGQIVIVKNGVKYSANGQILK